MRVLIACECSGIVRDEFLRLGHNAWSCDIKRCEQSNTRHIKTNVLGVINDNWDLMIAHPPCTDLAVSGARWFRGKQQEQADALEFVRVLMDAPIPRICIENPVSIISTQIRKPDQIIQPWQFGHEETKTTCLWLKNLPKLEHGRIMETRNKNLTPTGQNKLGPSADRATIRSRTYQGIAVAMAQQWGNLGPYTIKEKPQSVVAFRVSGDRYVDWNGYRS